MHHSFFWGSSLSLIPLLGIIAISYIAGISALPQMAPPGAQVPDVPGNFTGSCTDIQFDMDQCVLSAQCKNGGNTSQGTKLNLNKCLFYGKMEVYSDDYTFYWYGTDKDGKVANYDVDQYRFRCVSDGVTKVSSVQTEQLW